MRIAVTTTEPVCQRPESRSSSLSHGYARDDGLFERERCGGEAERPLCACAAPPLEPANHVFRCRVLHSYRSGSGAPVLVCRRRVATTQWNSA